MWKGWLLKTAAECDPEFDDRTQAIRAEVIGNGIELMRAGMASRSSRSVSE